MKVNALIIGAQKSGTTSFFHYIKQHPDIYFSEIKELKYFLEEKNYAKGLDHFHSYFYKHSNEKIIASSHVHLLANEASPKRVHEYNPNMKLIILLRDPVKRAFSSYNYAVQKGWENIDTFNKALEAEESRLNDPSISEGQKLNLTYIKSGEYYKNIQNWLKFFPREQFFIATTHELKNNRPELLKRLFEFLEIDAEFEISDVKRMNETGKTRSRGVQKIISLAKFIFKPLLNNKIRTYLKIRLVYKLEKLNTKKIKVTEELDKEVEAKLYSRFEEDMNKMETDFNVVLKK